MNVVLSIITCGLNLSLSYSHTVYTEGSNLLKLNISFKTIILEMTRQDLCSMQLYAKLVQRKPILLLRFCNTTIPPPPTTTTTTTMPTTPAPPSSTTSFYELLALPLEYHPSQDTPIPTPIPAALLRKTYRKTSLLYHPDKNPSPDAAAHFHTLTTAYDVLSDAAAKQAYDQALVAGLVRKRKSEVMGSERRRLKEELEARERAAAAAGVGVGWKKQKTEMAGGDEVAEFERQLGRLQEEGAKLRMKREEALRRAEVEAKEEEEKEEERERKSAEGQAKPEGSKNAITESMFSEMDKTIFIKLRTDQNPPITITESTLTKSLSRFGEISSCLVRSPPPPTADSDKKKKKKRKEALITGVLVFKSILSAYDAVHTFRNGQEREGEDSALWGRVKEVKFAGGKDPDVSGLLPRGKAQAQAQAVQNQVSTDAAQNTAAGGQHPKFSFRPTTATSNMPTGTQKVGVGLSSADYESVTLLRMRGMERRMLEAEIRAKEEKEAEAER